MMLERVIINGIPNIDEGTYKPYIQLFQQGNLIYSSIDKYLIKNNIAIQYES